MILVFIIFWCLNILHYVKSGSDADNTAKNINPPKPRLLRSISTPMIFKGGEKESSSNMEFNLNELDIIVFRIDSKDTVMLWDGEVKYKEGYTNPEIGDNIIDYWLSYELAETIACYHLAKVSRKPQRVTKEANSQHYVIYFTPNLQNTEEVVSGYVINIDFLYDIIAETERKYEDGQMIHNALTSHQTRYQCYNILMRLESISETVPALKKTRITDVINQQGKLLTHDELCDELIGNVGKAKQLTSILLKRQQQCEDVIACQQGTMILNMKTFDVVRLVQLLWKDLHCEARQKNIRFCLQIEPLTDNRLPFIKQDEFRFKQICTTLLENAIQFTPKAGTVHIYLGLDHNNIQFTVTDSGSGIDENILLSHQQKMHLGKLSFSQPKPTAGLGYSLAIIDHIIRLMQGSMQILSGNTDASMSSSASMDDFTDGDPDANSVSSYTFSVGTKIIVNIPCHSDPIKSFYSDDPECIDIEPVILDKSSAKISQNRYKIDKRETIMVVDDDPIIRKLWEKVLSQLGYVCHLISDGEEAVRYYENHHTFVALIIMDIQMPYNGIDATREIRAWEQKIDLPCRIKIIANTASGSSGEFRLQCQNAGMTSFIQKPNAKREIKRIIEQYATFN